MIDEDTKAARKSRIVKLLTDALSPVHLTVKDESYLHVGHPGAAGGGGHYHIDIVSEAFAGQTRVQRHRTVYDALGVMLDTEIHALGIDARAPEEADAC